MEICRLKHHSLSCPSIAIIPTAHAVLVSSEDGSVRYMTPEGEELGYAEVSKDFDRPVKATAVNWLFYVFTFPITGQRWLFGSFDSSEWQ